MLFCVIFPLIVSGVAMIMDFRSMKVDNGWLLFSFVVSLGVRLLTEGRAGVFDLIAGTVFPLLLLGGLFVFQMMGAGDIKLFCALGAVMGAEKTGKCILASFFLGACISLAFLLSTGDISQRFLYFIQYFQDLFKTGRRKPYRRKGISFPENFHFTVPVFLSVVLYAGGVY